MAITMEPGVTDITIYQGIPLAKVFRLEDGDENLIDLTGYTARMQARPKVGSTRKILDLTTANGGIVLGGELATVEIILTATATAALLDTSGVYDIELVDGAGVPTRFLMGNLIISKEVTR